MIVAVRKASDVVNTKLANEGVRKKGSKRSPAEVYLGVSEGFVVGTGLAGAGVGEGVGLGVGEIVGERVINGVGEGVGVGAIVGKGVGVIVVGRGHV